MAQYVMLAHGESGIVPALLFGLATLFIVYPVSLWVFLSTITGSQKRSVIVCAVGIAIVGGAGVIAVLKDFEWPPDGGLVSTLLMWAVPLLCGLLALFRGISRWKGGKS